MYLFYGVIVWVLALITFIVTLKLYPKFSKNPTALTDVQTFIRDISNVEFKEFMLIGFVSGIIIIAWPIILFILSLMVVLCCFAGIPYLIIRSMRTPVKDDPDWVVPPDGPPRKRSRRM